MNTYAAVACGPTATQPQAPGSHCHRGRCRFALGGRARSGSNEEVRPREPSASLWSLARCGPGAEIVLDRFVAEIG